MAAHDSLSVHYFGQKGLYGVKNLNGNAVPTELNQYWTHKEYAEQALVKYVEDQRNGSSKGKQTVQSVRKGADN